MQRHIASLATVALLFVVCPGVLPASAQAPEAPPSDAVADTAGSAERASPVDPARAEAPGEPSEGSAEPESAAGEGSAEPDSAAEEGSAEPESAAGEESAEPESAAEAGEGTAEPAAVAPSGLRVLRAYICKGIEQSEPTEAGKSFIPTSDGVLRLCCFSEIGGATATDTVYHAWYWGDREMARVPLRVQGARWRTWSSKRIIDEWRGDWRVDIVDRDEFVLERLPFSVE